MNRHVDSSAREQKRRWRRRVAVFFGAAAIAGLWTANPALTIAGVCVLPALFALLWRPREPPILLFAATFQWLQVFVPVVQSNVRGEVLGTGMWFTRMDTAAWLGLATIVVLAIGMRLGARSMRIDPRRLAIEVVALSQERLALAYVASFILGIGVARTASLIPGLRQQLITLVVLRWVVIFLIGWSALRRPELRLLALIVVAIELALGFTGYFSSFKSVIFLALVLIGGSGVSIRRIFRPMLFAFLALAFLLLTFWQAVKDDYRRFLSQGEKAQVVLVPVADRFDFLLRRASEVTFGDLRSGFDEGLDRVGYLEFFAQSMANVPARIPYQHGRLWIEAFQHVAMPRAFFPDKPAIDDSVRTREFTGLRVAGAEHGASISIGYAGESYIDFGPIGMFVPIFMLGVFWGWSYAWLFGRTRYALLGLAVSTNLILGGAINFEVSSLKLLGGSVTAILVLWLVLRFGDGIIWRFVAPQVVDFGVQELRGSGRSVVSGRYARGPFRDE